jgi:lipoprotein
MKKILIALCIFACGCSVSSNKLVANNTKTERVLEITKATQDIIVKQQGGIVMSKYSDFQFIPSAKQKIVTTFGGSGYRTVFLCPFCNQELKFIAKEVQKCPICGNLVKKGLVY